VFGIKFQGVGYQINFDNLRFQNIMCFNGRFFGAWLVCFVFILCFGFQFSLVIVESYLESSKYHV
jgi:hypothetical protein